MNTRFIFGSVLLFFLFCAGSSYAQGSVAQKPTAYKIGIFAPLYLDSVFNKNTFRYRQGVPRFIMPAVDFVQGAMIALDSLQDGDQYFDATIYDSKSFTQPVADLIRDKKLDSLQLIIGHIKDEEYRQLAAFAQTKNIPFISATYPNDGGITANPNLVIMNSTLRSHCEAIYSYVLQNHGTDKIYLVRQKGEQEDMVASYFKRSNEREGKPLLPIETIIVDAANLNSAFLKTKLDSNSKNVIIAGSLDETFAGKIAKAGAELNKVYSVTLLGMPTWDNFPALYKKEIANFPVYYTTPFYTNKLDAFSKTLTAAYNKKYKGKPSDMAYKGFESVYLFSRLLAKNPAGFMSNINDKSLQVFSEYNFRPVRINEQSINPDYYENKHLYLIRILNGAVSKAW